MLELRSIASRLGSFSISNLDLHIPSGEYFVLLGPSGVGKTVLLEIIAGLIPPDAGLVLWQGKDITKTPPEDRRFSVVYQDYALFPHLTVAGNIAYGLKSRRTRSSEVKEAVWSMAAKLQLEQLLDRYPGTLSGGERQRVALARALVCGPQMLLLDEPLSALDTNTRQKLQRELKRIQAETKTTFFHVTHDPEEALGLADRMGVMLGQRIRQQAAPEELFRRPSDREVSEFLGMKNILAASTSQPGLVRSCGVQIHASAATESTSHVWIKPEEILLSGKTFESSARNQFKCRVNGWNHQGGLLAIQVSIDTLGLTALVTHESFNTLGIQEGKELYCTFKSSAVHCF